MGSKARPSVEEENDGRGGEGRGGEAVVGRGKEGEREERKEHRLFQPHAEERGREEMEGGGTQQHIVVSKARRRERGE